jgi:hypothetical protein
MELINILKDTAEFTIATVGVSSWLYQKKTEDIFFRIALFAASQTINEYWLKPKDFPKFFEQEKNNNLIKGYGFSIFFQVFIDSIVLDRHDIIVEDIIDISLVYATNFVIESI